MKKTNSFYDTVDQIVTDGVNKGILHLYNEDTLLTGNTIRLKNNDVVNFGSCSYLGLEFDSRLKDAAKEAVDNYGTQFSESRAYVSVGLYKELENLLEQIFEKPCVVTPTTTLGHIATIPVVVNDDDAVIIDHQVHNSVQIAVGLLKARGVYTELLRHNRMDLLEERVKALKLSGYKKIWYMADGIYSMYGDTSPVDAVYKLMDTYSELYYYVDDAHGMSILGKNGKGYVLNNRKFHTKMILATSFAKAFATGGAAIIFPDKELARRVRTCGGPLITSGPMQPSALGAAIASAKIHLSDEITEMQQELHDNIEFANLMLKKYKLPIISESDAAVFFVGVSLPKMGYNMIKRMLNRGYYLNLGIFPAVPMKNTGIRFTITRLHSFAQIEEMIAAMAGEFQFALLEEGLSMEQIYKAFKLLMPEELLLEQSVSSVITQSLSLQTSFYKTINEVDKAEWDGIFENKGTFDWEGMQVLENSFTQNELPEDNWEFDYVIIRDNNNKPVVATFLTTALWKDDMLSPAGVSAIVEEKRLTDPYYLTSTVIAAGSLLTEGEHIYIDKESDYWKDAMQLLFERIYELQEKYKATNIVLRDFSGLDTAMDSFFVDNGFFRVAMPENNIVNNLDWNTDEEFYNHLSPRSRQHFREDIRKHEDKFEVAVTTSPTAADIDYWYGLYLNVKNNNLALNTFTLPKKVFEQMCRSENWEVLLMTIKKEFDYNTIEKPVNVVFSYKTGNAYMPMVMGMDYTYNKDFKIYRQALYQLVKRAKRLDKEKVCLGFSAGIEKKKVGAEAVETYAYMQAKDNFNFQVLADMVTAARK
jgi:7-keto-8-aminopelargonate synthetase-like enzyme